MELEAFLWSRHWWFYVILQPIYTLVALYSISYGYKCVHIITIGTQSCDCAAAHMSYMLLYCLLQSLSKGYT